jgi:hypothetical protein
VGGGSDDLSIEGWPEGALIFRRVGGGVSVEATVAAVIDGVSIRAGHIEPCVSGTLIEIAGEALRVLVASEVGGMVSTAQDVSAPNPSISRIRLSGTGMSSRHEISVVAIVPPTASATSA